ncbi:hypothetical protein HNQ96_005414 [Aminobacter lissarensis]|uniref:Uncharacterized protein n=1 Tax=Aminobacter carboxidus TaxID=376165 RepID=A0A8E2BFI7_9HYPH|nr:hypothetical protein [Aminobacter lissarensis]
MTFLDLAFRDFVDALETAIKHRSGLGTDARFGGQVSA